MADRVSKLKHPPTPDEEIELDQRSDAALPFVAASPSTPKLPQSPGAHLRTPLDTRRSAPPLGNGAVPGEVPARPLSWTGSATDLNSLSVSVHDPARRLSALDIMSCGGSETAAVAVERARERRAIVICMHNASQTLLYILPTLIVVCLILFWTVPGEHTWLTMLAAIIGCICVIDFIFYQYFSNQRDGTDLNNTLARFRARLKRSGRRF